MGLPSTGSISMSQVNTELKKASNAAISLNDSAVRKLAGKTSGTISMSDLRGKKASESVTNYQVYSNSWKGWMRENEFNIGKITFPKKIIQGILIVQAKTKKNGNSDWGYLPGKVIILDTIVQDTTKNINISNLYYVDFKYSTGKSENEDGNGGTYGSTNTLSVDVKFTGEWES